MSRTAKDACLTPTAASLRGKSKAKLADEFGALSAQLKPLEKRADAFKAEFERRALTLLVGERFSVQRSETSFQGIDVPAAKAALGVAWCESHEKTVSRVSWKAARLNEADAADSETEAP